MLLNGPPLLSVKLDGGVGVLDEVPKIPDAKAAIIDPSVEAVTAEGVIDQVVISSLFVAEIVGTESTPRNAEYSTPMRSVSKSPDVVQEKV